MNLGINLCFAVKRYLEPEEWAEFVRCDLELDRVQFTFDLLDPWWPESERAKVCERIAKAVEAYDLDLHSAYVGLAHYMPGGLLDPDPTARRIAADWWRRACDTAAALGARAVGGPLGTMSVRDAADLATRERRYSDLLDGLEGITGHAVQVGLAEFLIEPTPVVREIPSTIHACRRLLDDLTERCPIPVGFTLDVGHTVYEPLYGPGASTAEWINGLDSSIRLVHLDNTDGQGDPHWGWPHPLGRVDVAAFGADMRAAGLGDVPLVLEVFPRFEDDDELVRRTIASSVAHCKKHLDA